MEQEGKKRKSCADCKKLASSHLKNNLSHSIFDNG